MQKKTTSFLFFLIGIIFALSVVGFLWMKQLPSLEEGVATASILHDCFKRLGMGVAGLWNPHFLMGYNQLLYLIKGIPYLIEGGMTTLLAPWVGELGALKITALIYFFWAVLAMYHLLLVVTRDRMTALAGGVLYLLMPEMIVRGVIYEHMGCVLCFTVIPLLMASLWKVALQPKLDQIFLLGILGAVLFFTYAKIAIMVSPLLLLWALEGIRRSPVKWQQLLRAYGVSGVIFLLLVVPFLPPLLREYSFTARFLFTPFLGQQQHYSLKSMLEIMDSWGFFLKGGGADLLHDRYMFLVGVIPMIIISLTVTLPSLAAWRSKKIGRTFLVFLACWLVSLWLASGPHSIFSAHRDMLDISANMYDWVLPLLWISLFWVLWLAYEVTHQLIGGAPWRSLFVVLFFFIAPLFRLLELLPIFHDIRAPESFMSIGGFVCCVGATAIGLMVLMRRGVPRLYRPIFLLVLGASFLVEMYPVVSSFWNQGVSPESWHDYQEVIAFLKKAPVPGRVEALTSDYFYLTLPQEIGREIDTEAHFRHFQLKWMRYLENQRMKTFADNTIYLNLAGVAYFYVDLEHASLSQDMLQGMANQFSLVSQNKHFLLFENNHALYPAFIAHDFVVFPVGGYTLASVMMPLLGLNVLPLERLTANPGDPGFGGVFNQKQQLELVRDFNKNPGEPFERIDEKQLDRSNAIWDIHLQGDQAGWLVLNQAYHPDWKVSVDGLEKQVVRAGVGLMAVELPLGAKNIHFYLEPPFWYTLSLGCGIILWLSILGIWGMLKILKVPKTNEN